MSGDYLADSPEHKFEPQDRLPDRCGFVSDGMSCGYDRKCHEALWPCEPSASEPDLAAFLAARYDEAEAIARESYYEGQHWLAEDEIVYLWPGDEPVHSADRKADARFIVDVQPKRRLADIKLKRAILAEHHHYRVDYNITARTDLDAPFGCPTCHIGNDGDMYEGGWCATVRQLGTEFTEHAAYKQEWAP